MSKRPDLTLRMRLMTLRMILKTARGHSTKRRREQMPDSPQPGDGGGNQPSPDFVTLKEFFSVFVKIITTLAGFGALYLLFGYTIILSFISTVRLYGLTSFTSDFYKEATINFLSNMLETYADHLKFTFFIIFLLSGLYLAFKKYDEKLKRFYTAFEIILLVVTLGIILGTLRLGYLYDDFYTLHHARELFLFGISIPFLLLLMYFLAVNFKKFYGEPYTYYYVISLLTGVLYLGIPISYGDNIFDLVLYPVVGVELNSDKSEAITKLNASINCQGSIPLFYFMGYSTDKLILFDNQTLSTPAKMIILNKDTVKYINISNSFKNRLRNLVRYQKNHRIDPVPQPKHKLTFEIMSGSDLKTKKAPAKLPEPSLAVIKPGKGIGEIALGDSIATAVDKMKLVPNLARKISYEGVIEYWLNYEDLGLAFIFNSDKSLSKIAINNPTMVLDNNRIRVKSPLTDLYESFEHGEVTKYEQGYKLINYPYEGISFTVDPKEGKIFTITVFKKTPLAPGPKPLSGL
jgi:hypothetical protein